MPYAYEPRGGSISGVQWAVLLLGAAMLGGCQASHAPASAVPIPTADGPAVQERGGGGSAGNPQETTQEAGSGGGSQDPGQADAAPEADPGFFLWTDTSISILPYGWGFEVDSSEQTTFTLEHAHASTIGDFFGFVDVTRFHGGDDDWTWYGELGPRLSMGKIFGEDLSFTTFERGLFEFKDVLIAAQYERGEDADQANAALLGVGFDLDVHEGGFLGPLGKFNYIQLNLYARAELGEGVEHGFRDAQVSMVASRPFMIGGSRILIDGYFDWVLGLGAEDWSFHLNPQLKYDIGHTWGEPEKFYAGIELDFWWNKYQIPDSAGFDTDQYAVSLLLQYHF